jgi:hypothetical protein
MSIVLVYYSWVRFAIAISCLVTEYREIKQTGRRQQIEMVPSSGKEKKVE